MPKTGLKSRLNLKKYYMARIVIIAKNTTTPNVSSEVNILKTFDFQNQFDMFKKSMAAKKNTQREDFYETLTIEEKLLERTYHIDVNDKDAKKILEQILKDPNIESAKIDELNILYFTPNDPLLSNLWAMPKIKAPQAWDISTGNSIVIAVCDTGVDKNHPDLVNNIWFNSTGNFGYDFSNNNNNPIDYQGHGTHVAGTIAASGNNAQGVVGVSYNVKIMSVKIFPNAYNSVCAQAIMYAANNGARIINCSWGPATHLPVSTDPVLKAAIDYAYTKNCYCVFAAGNKNIDCSTQFPANYNKVITVGATDQNDQKPIFSNWGSVVDISAPGVGILSTKINGGYLSLQGTSMAAPHVAGATALLLSLAPRLSFSNILYFLRKSSDAISTSQPTINKRLNCFKLLQPSTIQFKRQTQVDTSIGRFALQNAGNHIAFMRWVSNSWVKNVINVWGSVVINGSLEKLGTNKIGGVNSYGNMVNTYGNLPNLSYAPIHETFGLIPGTLRYSNTKDAIFAVNVFNDFVYMRWIQISSGNFGWIMDIISNWTGLVNPASFQLNATDDGIICINNFGVSCHTWSDPNGQTLTDGTKISVAMHSNLNNLIF